MHKQLGIVAVGLALAACSKSGGGSGGGGGDSDHWTKRPLVTITAKANTQVFQIEVPKGMRMTSRDNAIGFDIEEHDRVFTPDITIGDERSSSLEEFMATQDAHATFTRKEKVGNGFIVSGENDAYPGKQDYLVHSEVETTGGRALTCDARVTPYRPGDNVKADLLPQVEKICLSLRTAPAGAVPMPTAD